MEPVREVVSKHYLDIMNIPHTTSSLAYRASMHHILVEILQKNPNIGQAASAIIEKFSLHTSR